MTDSLFPLLLLLAAAFGGALVGIMVGAICGTRIAQRAWEEHMPKLPSFVVIDNITLNTQVHLEDDVQATVIASTGAITSRAMSARVAERWLDEHNLMMVPKGKDFEVKAPKVGGGNALG
jgi:hypothetical protein